MVYKGPSSVLLLLVLLCTPCKSAWATFVIHSQTAVNIELTGYNGLADSSLFKGSISAGGKREIDTPYRGLALLSFVGGQRYPVIIGDNTFTLKIKSPADPPIFAGSGENDFFYTLLSGSDQGKKQYPFALLMMEAKKLLDSSHSIRTIKELTAKKKEFHEFVRDHYSILKHSDMVRRLIAQYFMMHEYVNYHTKGAPATDIRVHYQKAVINGVGNWLETLKPYIPEHEILNYCVSLYYKRSMVTLASLIVENYQGIAYCPGDEKKTFSFPKDLLLTEAKGNKKRRLEELKGKKIIAFVSDDCPVSMVETITKVRRLSGRKKEETVIVAPLQQLSENHLAMNRMVNNGNMLFINDEKWRKKNQLKNIKLPLFISIGDGFE